MNFRFASLSAHLEAHKTLFAYTIVVYVFDLDISYSTVSI